MDPTSITHMFKVRADLPATHLLVDMRSTRASWRCHILSGLTAQPDSVQVTKYLGMLVTGQLGKANLLVCIWPGHLCIMFWCFVLIILADSPLVQLMLGASFRRRGARQLSSASSTATRCQLTSWPRFWLTRRRFTHRSADIWVLKSASVAHWLTTLAGCCFWGATFKNHWSHADTLLGNGDCIQ